MRIKKIAVLGVLCAIAIVLGAVEGRIIPVFLPTLPGVKAGLSNLSAMLAVSYFGLGGGLAVAFAKAVFAFAVRGFTAGMTSLFGGLLSILCIRILIKAFGKHISFVGIGMMSAVFHSLGQLLGAIVISGTPELLTYGRILLPLAMLTGAFTGLVLNLCLPRMEKAIKFLIR